MLALLHVAPDSCELEFLFREGLSPLHALFYHVLLQLLNIRARLLVSLRTLPVQPLQVNVYRPGSSFCPNLPLSPVLSQKLILQPFVFLQALLFFRLQGLLCPLE